MASVENDCMIADGKYLDSNGSSSYVRLTTSKLTVTQLTEDGGNVSVGSKSFPSEDIIAFHVDTSLDCNGIPELRLHFQICTQNPDGAESRERPSVVGTRKVSVLTFRAAVGSDDASLEANKWSVPIYAPTASRFSRKILFIINARSGRQDGGSLFDANVMPLLTLAGVPYEAVVTQYRNHAQRIVMETDLSQYSGVAIMSGDGMVYEVINGLMLRSDWPVAAKTPLAIFPAGTASALAGSVFRASGENPSVKDRLTTAAYLLLRHRITPVNMAYVESSAATDKKPMYSMIMSVWGIFAQINNSSDAYRWLGPSRVMFASLIEIAKFRTYTARLDYLLFDDDATDEDHTDVCKSNTDGSFKPRYLKPLGQPVPSAWKTIEGEFLGLFALVVSNLSDRLCMLPEARIDDGAIHLVVMKAGATRRQLSGMFGRIARVPGYRLDQESFVRVLKVRAYRIASANTNCAMAIDGEAVPFGVLQSEIVPGVAHLMARIQ